MIRLVRRWSAARGLLARTRRDGQLAASRAGRVCAIGWPARSPR